MIPWFRFYHEALDDPKVQRLPPELFRHWVNCLCLAARNDGDIPSIVDVSFAFRVSRQEAEKIVSDLVDVDLLDRFKGGKLRPHNWDSRQFKSDVSTDRVKRFRKRSKTVSVTADETDQNRTEQNREIPPIIPLLELGEFKRVKITQEQHDKLKAKLNGNLENFIVRFDLWVNEAPQAKASGVRRQDRHAYESILAWFDKDVKEGKIKPTVEAAKRSVHDYL